MGVYDKMAVEFAKDLEKEFGSDYTLTQLLRFQAQDVGLITSKALGDYAIKKEFERILLDKNNKMSNHKICIDIAIRHNRSWQGVYILAREFYK